MKNKIVVLEAYTAHCGNKQRIIYDAEQDRIVHQFKYRSDGSRMPWMEDFYTSWDKANPSVANEYLPSL